MGTERYLFRQSIRQCIFKDQRESIKICNNLMMIKCSVIGLMSINSNKLKRKDRKHWIIRNKRSAINNVSQDSNVKKNMLKL